MKKVIAIIFVIFCVIGCTAVYATNDVNNNTAVEEAAGKLVELKTKELETIEDYKEAYGSDTYGFTAYILNKVRIYSIPFGFVAIVVSAIYQYVLGIRKLDVRDKGFAIMISSITILVICQVLPLVFAIVVKGWRG